MHFYTNREAADAIAMELHADNPGKRAQVAEQHWHAIHTALCAGDLTGRDKDARLPMTRCGLVAAIAYADCLISETDLNDWLDRLGIGIQVSSPIPAIEEGAAETVPEEDTKAGIPALDKPTSAQLAEDLGPYLQGGQDSEWLRRVLNEVARTHKRMQKFRTLTDNGRTATWDVGAVVLYLYGEKHLTSRSARAFLEQKYPKHLFVTEKMDQSDGVPQTATWFSPLT